MLHTTLFLPIVIDYHRKEATKVYDILLQNSFIQLPAPSAGRLQVIIYCIVIQIT